MPHRWSGTTAPAFRVQETEKKLFLEGHGEGTRRGGEGVMEGSEMEGSKLHGRSPNEPDGYPGGPSPNPKNHTCIQTANPSKDTAYSTEQSWKHKAGQEDLTPGHLSPRCL